MSPNIVTKKLNIGFLTLIFVCTIFIFSCKSIEEEKVLFKRLPATQTGIDFSNDITESESLNIALFTYMYNGGGVGIGDFNNDGLQDLFFSGNMVPSKLYLNKGEMQFEDVTAFSKIDTEGIWASGVSVVDINNDGLLDIYLCTSGPKAPGGTWKNLLYINQGGAIPTFVEQADDYGIGNYNYTTHAAFFDFDLDGDLDLYVLTNNPEDHAPNNFKHKSHRMNGEGVDFLYRNEGADSNGQIHFTDVSKESGIVHQGYGLGIGISDFNDDGWPDVYVSNDYISDDLLYINNQDGTFTEDSSSFFSHTALNSMGNDISDFNNDGLVDVFTVDMRPSTSKEDKLMTSVTGVDFYIMSQKFNYQKQFLKNSLQLNMGQESFGDIAYLSGVAATDWSWGPLFADFDNDGLKDLHITNGYVKKISNLDFINYGQYSHERLISDKKLSKRIFDELLQLQDYGTPNKIYRNNGDITFDDKTESWGLNVNSVSNGSAYVDLDNDGDLDIVANNINQKAFVYENKSNVLKPDYNFLKIQLKGDSLNTMGIGAKVKVYTNGKLQVQEQSLYRGYQSSIDPILHFGLGRSAVDSIVVHWSVKGTQVLKNIVPGMKVVVHQKEAGPNIERKEPKKKIIFNDITDTSKLALEHRENSYMEFKKYPLQPYGLDKEGIKLAIGDVNGDGLDDFYFGGAHKSAGVLSMQTENGTFSKVIFPDPEYEDVAATFFDADGDMDMDLYVVSGGSEFLDGHFFYRDRLYINDGTGNFKRNVEALPKINVSGSIVLAEDIDGDGDKDLFVGGRCRPGKYGYRAKSSVLINQNGKFLDRTAVWLEKEGELGMATDAIFIDLDEDGRRDLLVAAEYAPIKVYINTGERFILRDNTGLEDFEGMWLSIATSDMDSDGDMDIVAGNLGLNTVFTHRDRPIQLFSQDFDKNGSVDPILCYLEDNERFIPFHYRNDLLNQLVFLRAKFTDYKSYSEADIVQILGEDMIKEANKARANYFQTAYIENISKGHDIKFKVSPLPKTSQVAPIMAIHIDDFNKDGKLDILMGGNNSNMEVSSGPSDASRGHVLLGDGTGNFIEEPLHNGDSEFFGDIRDISPIKLSENRTGILIAKNSGKLKMVTLVNNSTN